MRKQMFNPLRLFRRRDHIDDSATAYIEGRMTPAEKAELESRMAGEPGLGEELESLRATVTLLRSIEPARAPRSFALSEAPARARRQSGLRLAMAPAIVAVVAAAGVGLLAVGSLADVVSQSGSNGGSEVNRSASFSTAYDGDLTPIATDMAGTAEIGSSTLPPLALSTGTPAPVTGLDSQKNSLIPNPEGTSVPEDQAGLTAPDAGDTFQRVEPGPDNAGATSAIEIQPDEGTEQAAIDSQAPAAAPLASNGNDDALSLPLWQLEVALAALAAVMTVLWIVMIRRRASAEADS